MFTSHYYVSNYAGIIDANLDVATYITLPLKIKNKYSRLMRRKHEFFKLIANVWLTVNIILLIN